MSRDAVKNDMNRVGLFQEMSYVTVQDPYVPASKFNFNENASKGKQMLPGPAKDKATGLQDGYFDKKFGRVFESEGYSDPIGTRRRQRMKESKKNISTKPFITFQGEKKPEGLGSNFGTFAGKFDFFSSKPRDGKAFEPQKPNIKTNPPKKGTGYGYPNIGLSKYPEYKGDKYEGVGGSKSAEEHKKSNVNGPFKAGVFQKVYFDKNPYLTEKDGPVFKEKKRSNSESGLKLFKPSSPPKTMLNLDGFLTKYPQHMDDPWKTQMPRLSKRVVNNSGKLFTPQQGPKSKRQTSVIDYNIRVRVNSTNYRQAQSFSTYNLNSISVN